MMEPINAVTLSLALSAGAVAGTELIKAVVKDGYDRLKALVISRYPGVSVEPLKQTPDSKACRAVVEEDLATAGAMKDAELVEAAQNLIDLIRQQAPAAAAAIDVDLKDVEAANLRLRDIAASGTR